jgi:hypothetical protein
MDEGPSVSPPVRGFARYHAAPWLFFVVALGSARNASAEEHTATATPPATAGQTSGLPAGIADPAAPTADSEVPGADLFRQAEARYVTGDIVGALALMEEAYAASGRPELLFNLGQLHRELGHCNEARDSYEHYLALAKNGTRRDEAEQRRRELERQCPPVAAPAGATAHIAVPEAPTQEPSYWTPGRIAGWATLGGSVVFAGTASYFALHAHHLQNQYESDLREAKTTGSPYLPAYDEIASDGQHAAVVARGLALSALGLAAVGVSLIVFNPGGRHAEMNAVSVRCNADGATAVYRGTF